MVESANRHVLADGRSVVIRPVVPDDAAAELRFFAGLSPRTRLMRFHRPLSGLDDILIRFYTRIDQKRHAGFVCEHAGEIVGDARYVANPGARSCELGIVVGDAWHHTGIAQLLLDALIGAAREHGFDTLEGLVLSDNADMLDFARTFGFEVQRAAENPGKVRVVKRL
jgi:acetyltransferase